MSGVEIDTAFISVAGGHVRSFNCRGGVNVSGRDGEVTEDDVDRVLHAAQAISIPHDREIFHILPQEYTLDGQGGIKQPVGMAGHRLLANVHVVTGATGTIQNIVACVNRAGIEVSDVFISLKPKEEWSSGRSKEELVAAMAEALEQRVPGMRFSFTQPIEMRFNELIAGVRSDVAVSVFGDDLDVLERLGGEVAALLRRVPGAADVRADQVQGLPVLRIVVDHARAARYGIPVDDILGISLKATGAY